MIEIIRYDPNIKRIRTFIDQTNGIQWFTRNNLYPQIVEAIRDRSSTIGSACKELGRFIAGGGFTDQNIAGLVVNSKGETLNDILKAIKPDAATYEGSFVVHLGVNMLGQYNSISVWPLSYWRLGLPDSNGDVHDLKYNSNWERDPYKEVSNEWDVVKYPKFNPDPEFIKEQIDEFGLEYPGQVLYFTPLEDQYPLATYDSVLDQGQTQEEIGIFRLASIQNGMNAGSIFSYPGKFENKEKEKQFKESLNDHKGGKGANSIIVIENEGEVIKAQELITPLTIQNADRIHEFISKDNKDLIIESFAMPKIILGIQPDSGMFNRAEIEDSYYYYNTKTQPYRDDISRAFRKIFSNWHQPVESDFAIKQLQYVTLG